MMQDDSLIPWAGGFFDGEGYIGYTRCNGYLALRIEVAQVDPRPLLVFTKLFGGSIKKTTNGKRPGWRPAWRWYISTGNAASALGRMLPWLVVKREQAELAIRSRKLSSKGARLSQEMRAQREQIAHEMTRLKHAHPRELVGLNNPLLGKQEEHNGLFN